MAPEENKTKKRKGAIDASPKAKKLKKSEDAAAVKPSKALKSAVKPIDDVAINTKVSRKKAQELYIPDEKIKVSKKSKVVAGNATTKTEVVVEAEPVKTKKEKKGRHAKEEKAVTVVAVAAAEAQKPKVGKKTEASIEEPTDAAAVKKSKKEKVSPEDDIAPQKNEKKPKKKTAAQEQSEAEADEHSEEEGDEDDQTAALLAGFESSEDEADPEDDDNFSEKRLQADISGELRGELEKAEKKGQQTGVVYVGRIPHGFYEHQMKAYFSQFGQVTRLRLSRNKKTGQPKHYAFVEFASSEVADIVARTMDKYLLFGHILQCRVIPSAQVHPDLFKGANRRFKAIPRSKIAASELKHGAERAVWEKRVEREEARRQRKNKKLQEALGYTFDAPTLKSVDAVPKSDLAIEASENEPKALTGAPIEEAEPVVKPKQDTSKAKRSKKAKKDVESAEVEAETLSEEPFRAKKAKNETKSKVEAEAVVENGIVSETPKEKKRKAKSADQPEAEVKKSKKSKKAKA